MVQFDEAICPRTVIARIVMSSPAELDRALEIIESGDLLRVQTDQGALPGEVNQAKELIDSCSFLLFSI